MNHADDGDRLIQEVLTELSWDAEPRKITENVRRLDIGLPSEDQFIAICSPGVPFGLHEKIQNLAFIVDGTP